MNPTREVIRLIVNVTSLALGDYIDPAEVHALELLLKLNPWENGRFYYECECGWKSDLYSEREMRQCEGEIARHARTHEAIVLWYRLRTRKESPTRKELTTG